MRTESETSTLENGSRGAHAVSAPKEDIDLMDLLMVLARRRNVVLKVILSATLLAATIALLLPNKYAAIAKILPPQQTQGSSAAVLGQLGAMAGLPVKDFGVKNMSDLYVGMLQSRTIADEVIQQLSLKKYYEIENSDDARRRLASSSSFTFGKDGIIVVEVEEFDPLLAAKIANNYVDQLFNLNHRLAVTEASQRRLFFERQLVSSREALSRAEDELRRTQELTGMIHPEAQAKVTIEALSALRGQIAAKEVQLSSMRSFATESNPDLIRTERELSALRTQLVKLVSSPDSQGDAVVPTQKVPAVGLEYLRKFREVKYHETEVEFLSKQYELARIDEAKDSSLIQVLDRAVPPLRKSSPRRLLVVLFGALIGLIVGAMVAFLQELQQRVMSGEEGWNRVRVLYAVLRPKWL